MARFLEIPAETLEVEKEHENRSTQSEPLERLVEPQYLDECVKSVTGVKLARYFPEVRERADVSRLWTSV